MMDACVKRPLYFIIPAVAVTLFWAEMYVWRQPQNDRMKLLKFQFVLILEVIMSCLTVLVIKFSQGIPALSGNDNSCEVNISKY